MSWISVRLVAPLDSQRQSCLFWLLLKGTLIASPLSVSAMSCRMLLERKQLCNWSVSVGDRSFRKPADFFGGLSRRSWILHFLKNFTLIHYSFSLKFKLNCQHFPLPVLFSVNKALWFVLSALWLLFSAPFIQWMLLSIHLSQTESCSFMSPLLNIVVPVAIGHFTLYFHRGRVVQKISICSSRNNTFTEKTRSFSLFHHPSINKYVQTAACHYETLLHQAVWIVEVWFA